MIQRYQGTRADPRFKAGQNQRAFGRHNASHRVINIDIIRHGVNVQRHTVLAICCRIRHHRIATRVRMNTRLVDNADIGCARRGNKNIGIA